MRLFERTYYELLAAALKPGGIIASQASTVWDSLPQVISTYGHCKSVFPVTAYAVTAVPTYPSGQIGFVIGAMSDVSIESAIQNNNKALVAFLCILVHLITQY